MTNLLHLWPFYQMYVLSVLSVLLTTLQSRLKCPDICECNVRVMEKVHGGKLRVQRFETKKGRCMFACLHGDNESIGLMEIQLLELMTQVFVCWNSPQLPCQG